MTTSLKIRWENSEGQYTEEIWERGNDGVLYAFFMQLINLVRLVGKMENEVEGLEARLKRLQEELRLIKNDPSIGKLTVEDWPESPDY